MKILLILAFDRTYKYRRLSLVPPYAPLTLTSLAALVPKEFNAEIDLIDEGVHKPDYKDKYYDIVGISCVTSSSPRAYALAEYWKKKKAFVVLGGSHPTLNPEEASQHADSVVVGFGEKTWVQLLYDYKNKTTKKIYIHDNSLALSMPIPRRDLLGKGYMKTTTVIANRGCRNNCSYCSIPSLCGRNNFKRPIDEVIEEMKTIQSKYMILLDPSPISDKEYAKQLFEALIPLKLKWGGLSTINFAEDDELVDLMIRSGCVGTLIGFESIDQTNMKDCGKTFNKVSKYKENVRKLHEKKIPVLGCFVLGFDNDTVEGLNDLADIVEDIGIDLPRYAALTPFPGTSLFKKFDAERRILTRDWALYDCQHVVFQPKNMSPEQLQEILVKTWKSSYKLGRIFKKIFRKTHLNKAFTTLIELGFKVFSYSMIKNANADYKINKYLE